MGRKDRTELIPRHYDPLPKRRPARRIALLLLRRVESRRTYLLQAEDRLASVHVAMHVNIRVNQRTWALSSAAAKSALALRKISTARRGSQFSRSSTLSRTFSEAVGRACSASRTHRRSVSGVHHNFGAMAPMPAHCELRCGICSHINRIAHSRTVPEDRPRLRFGHVSNDSQEGISRKSGAVHTDTVFGVFEAARNELEQEYLTRCNSPYFLYSFPRYW
jgi:hypothetical protein